MAHLLITGGVIAFCIQHTDTRPNDGAGFYWTKIIRTGENNNANIKPALELLTSDAIYRENPTALFHQLCGARPATLLLESADIDSKDDLKSLLLVDSALRITALGDTVTIQALSANGAAAGAAGRRAALRIANQRQPNGRILTFPAVSSLLDEDARLCSLSVFDAFRLLQELVTVPANERERCSSAACSPMTWWPALKICRPASDTACGLLLLSGGDPAGHRPSDQAYPHPGEPVHAAGE